MFSKPIKPENITIVGLGYVGLPLTLAFSKELPTTGFDINSDRVEELSNEIDRNYEVSAVEISASTAPFTTDESSIATADFIVVTVPTPVTEDHQPDLRMLESASVTIGNQLSKRPEGLPAPIIVYESTTYPGCTERFCGPTIERSSGLKVNEGFFLGYSPERTNFGDKDRTLETVVKVVSGGTPEVAKIIGDTYALIAKAGIYTAPSIPTAEAAKVIENVQRDLNIALFNELAIIFDRMDIPSSDVFDAAATKWNFHRYTPGLVGGHCIPVDPYYLTHAASELGHDALVILGGRAMNESMPVFLAEKAESLVADIGVEPKSANALVLGATFKKDVFDSRNSKAIALAEELTKKFSAVHVYDPNIDFSREPRKPFTDIEDPFESGVKYGVVVLAVAHTEFGPIIERLNELLTDDGLVIDTTGSLSKSKMKKSLRHLWLL